MKISFYLLLFFLLNIFNLSCDPSTSDNDPGFQIVNTPIDDDDATTDDDDSSVENPIWDSSPPDETDEAWFSFSCSYLIGSAPLCLRHEGDFWETRPDCEIDGVEGTYIEEVLTVCTHPTLEGLPDHALSWFENGEIVYYAGGLLHSVTPLATPFRWFGEISYQDGSNPSPECLEAMESHGITWPPAFVLTRLFPDL